MLHCLTTADICDLPALTLLKDKFMQRLLLPYAVLVVMSSSCFEIFSSKEENPVFIIRWLIYDYQGLENVICQPVELDLLEFLLIVH